MGRDALKSGPEIVNCLKKGMNLFLKDPPDSEYQRGYLACMLEVKKWACGQTP